MFFLSGEHCALLNPGGSDVANDVCVCISFLFSFVYHACFVLCLAFEILRSGHIVGVHVFFVFQNSVSTVFGGAFFCLI